MPWSVMAMLEPFSGIEVNSNCPEAEYTSEPTSNVLLLPYKIDVAAPSGTDADIFQPLVLIFWKSKLILLGLPRLSYIKAEILRLVPMASSLGKLAPKLI